MQSHSALFEEAVRYGGRVVTEITALRQGAIELHPSEFPESDGNIEVARSRSLSLSVLDPIGELRTVGGIGPLSAYGTELHVRTGFALPDGTTELLPAGVFPIEKAPHDGGVIKVTAGDRSALVAKARFEQPYVITGTPRTVDAIVDLVASRLPTTIQLEVEITTDSGATVPLTVFQEGDNGPDPWEAAEKLAAADGIEVLFGPRGQLILRDQPDPAGQAPTFFHEPGPGNIFISGSDEEDPSAARNVAIAIGEGTNVPTPVRGVAEITATTHPLHPANIGRRPVFLVSPLITIQAQADRAARALLGRRSTGLHRLEFEAGPHPGHERGDVVSAKSPETGVDSIVVLEEFNLDVNLRSSTNYSTSFRRELT